MNTAKLLNIIIISKYFAFKFLVMFKLPEPSVIFERTYSHHPPRGVRLLEMNILTLKIRLVEIQLYRRVEILDHIQGLSGLFGWAKRILSKTLSHHMVGHQKKIHIALKSFLCLTLFDLLFTTIPDLLLMRAGDCSFRAIPLWIEIEKRPHPIYTFFICAPSAPIEVNSYLFPHVCHWGLTLHPYASSFVVWFAPLYYFLYIQEAN